MLDIKAEVFETWGTMGTDSRLEGLVKELHPIFNQGAACLKMRQAGGQSRSDFLDLVVNGCGGGPVDGAHHIGGALLPGHHRETS